MFTWEELAKISIMTEEERGAIHTLIPDARLFRVALEPYVRPNTMNRFPAVSSEVLNHIKRSQEQGRHDFSALLKAALQRRILDSHKGELLNAAGISDAEILLHNDALSCGLKLSDHSLWGKIVGELNRERAWPWEEGALISPQMVRS